MKKIISLLLIFAILIACNKREEKKESIKIPKGAILVDKNGNPIPLPKDKLIVVNFMAYSCSSCMEEIPILKKVLKEPEFKDRFTLIAIAIDGDKNDFSDPEFPIYANNSINQVRFPVPGTPTTYIITPEGKKLVYILGAVTEENLKKFLREALDKYKGAKAP